MMRKGLERKVSFRSFIISGKAEKFAWLFLFVLLCLRAKQLLLRPLWFDEALTVLNFALLESPAKIYHSYVIPNNQILHTIFLHWWIKVFSFDFLRLFPLLCGFCTLAFLWQLRRKSSNMASFYVLAVLAMSFPFALYATALRGYMLSAAAVAGGVWMVTRYLEIGKWRHLAGWFIFSLLGVGTMPGTLAGLAGAMLFGMGYCRWNMFRQRRIYLAGVAPLVAFMIFYLPIKDNLLRCAALGEGWQSGTSMLLALAMGVVFTFLPALIPAAMGHLRAHRLTPALFHLAIWLLPVPAAYLFKAAPFPRVFFPLFPVFALLLANGVRDFLAILRHKRGARYAFSALQVMCGCAVLWSGLCHREPFRQRAGALHPFPSGQDDFIDCHFAKRSFSPRFTAQKFKEYFPDAAVVYVTFESDPWALMYAFMENGVNTRIIFDGPAGKYSGVPAVAITHFNEDKRALETRFQCRYTSVFTSDNHTFWVVDNE
ncbi:MAG: hypothetical protein IJY46_01445 [Lentisphaeria bacterium]|nr:hypothetical protein [Lentisphaeria bacterium]